MISQRWRDDLQAPGWTQFRIQNYGGLQVFLSLTISLKQPQSLTMWVFRSCSLINCHTFPAEKNIFLLKKLWIKIQKKIPYKCEMLTVDAWCEMIVLGGGRVPALERGFSSFSSPWAVSMAVVAGWLPPCPLRRGCTRYQREAGTTWGVWHCCSTSPLLPCTMYNVQ